MDWWLSSGCFFFQAEDGIRDLTVTGVQTCALPIYLARRGVVAEPRPEDVIRRDDAVQRRLDHFLGSRGNDVEREVVPVHFVEQAREQAQVLLQTNPLAHFDQVLDRKSVV